MVHLRDGPIQERDDDHIEGGEEGAIGRAGIRQPQRIRPIGQEEQDPEHGSCHKMLPIQAMQQLRCHDDPQQDACGQEPEAHDPSGAHFAHRRFHYHGSQPPDGRRQHHERFVEPLRHM